MSVQMSEKLAVHGGEKSVTLPGPVWPIVDETDVQRVSEVVRSGVWSWVGPQERAFSEAYRDFIGSKFCVCLANGTVTLQCALQAVGVVPGDEVIVPGMTWVATAQAALDIGANVVLVDIDPETLAISPDAIRAAITPKTKAIIPVHLYGCMADMDAIMEIAKEHNLKVVEDVAHQQGSAWRGVCAGAIGHAGSYSFQQSKILTSGEGGAVTCNDPEIYKTIFALKQVGHTVVDPEANPFEPLTPGNKYGHNYRITEMQAALLRGGLSRLAAQNATREKNVVYLSAEIEKMNGPVRAARRDPRVTTQAYYGMTMHFDQEAAGGVTLETYRKALNAEGVGAAPIYAPVYRNPLLNLYDTTSPVPFRDPATIQNYRTLNLPNVEAAFTKRTFTLGHAMLLQDRNYMDQVLAAFRKVQSQLPSLRD